MSESRRGGGDRESGGGRGGRYCAWRTICLPVSVERYNYVSVKMGGEAGTFEGKSPPAFP